MIASRGMTSPDGITDDPPERQCPAEERRRAEILAALDSPELPLDGVASVECWRPQLEAARAMARRANL